MGNGANHKRQFAAGYHGPRKVPRLSGPYMRETRLFFTNNITQRYTDEYTTLRFKFHISNPLGAGLRLVTIPAIKRKGGQVKHASDIFPQALTELLAISEKARQQREARAKDTMQRDTRNGGRETARVSRKRVRQTELQFN